ncbi:MAG: response regulator [Gammaproteobacteria bacterium]|nr:response regulator [Gammaproteobacteria bacterium]
MIQQSQKRQPRERPLLFHQLRSSLATLLISISVIGSLVYHFSEELLISTVQESLKYHADFRKSRILALYHSERSWMESQASDIGLRRNIELLIQSIKKPVQIEDEFSMNLDSIQYQSDSLRLRKSLALSLEPGEELLILNQQDQVIFASDQERHNDEVGEFMDSSGFYGETILSRLLQKVHQNHQFQLSEFGYIELAHRSTLLMGIPVYSPDSKTVIATLIRTFHLSQLRELLQSYSGLGRSGEVLIAFQQEASFGEEITFINRFRNLDSHEPDEACRTLRISEPNQFPMRRALNRQNGAGWTLENNCREAYSIWSWTPELEWGMVVKQDRDEIMEPIWLLQYRILITSLLVMLFILWMVYRQSKMLVSPLKELTQSVENENIGSHQPGGVAEVNRLAKAFRDHSQELLNRTFLLEQSAAQQRNAKRETNLILDSMDEGLVVVDSQGSILRVNQKLVALVGENEEWLLKKVVDELFDQDNNLRTYSGRAIPVQVSRAHLGHQVGSHAAEVILIADLREFLSAQNAIRANKAKDQFLAMMSHELRTPLTSIIGYADILIKNTRQALSQKQGRMLHSIAVAGRTQLTLINDILDLSKIEAGKFEINEEDYNLSDLIEEIDDIFSLRAQEVGISFTIKQDIYLTHQLIGDSVRTGQILMNLLGNAIKFTEQGGVTLEIVPEKSEQVIRFMIQDSGIGMAPKVLDRLFKPFEQADSSITRKFGGTGLGLNISWNLAEMMGGHIDVESSEGNGSCFELTLPFRPSEKRAISKKSTHQEKEQYLLQGSVLLVEDTIELQLLASQILESFGATVTVASNGQECVEAALSQSYDVILMDKQMPVMSGLEATRILRELGYKKPIYALTADVMKEQQEELFTAGVDGVLGKPIDQSELKKTLKKHLEVVTELADNRAETEAIDDTQARLRPLFMERMGELKRELKQALDDKEQDPLLEITHIIKGSAGSYGYPKISDLASTINQQLIGDQLTPATAHEIVRLIDEIEQIIAQEQL